MDAAVLLGLPSAAAAPRLTAAAPLLLTVDVDGGGSRPLALHVTGAGLACCTVELVAAALRSERARAAGAHAEEPQPGDADTVDTVDTVDVLVVSGTLTDVLAPALAELHASLPAGTPVLSFGACSASGGPYWDSYSVTKGIGGLLPVDVYVPGCPPRPEALVEGLRMLPGVAS